jgi:hypothetical protein
MVYTRQLIADVAGACLMLKFLKKILFIETTIGLIKYFDNTCSTSLYTIMHCVDLVAYSWLCS